jgi:hypothetical protein
MSENKENVANKDELERLVDVILNHVVYYCDNISGHDILTCMENHYYSTEFLEDDWYLGDSPEEVEENSKLLEDYETYKYVENRLQEELQGIIDELEEKYGKEDEEDEDDDEW